VTDDSNDSPYILAVQLALLKMEDSELRFYSISTMLSYPVIFSSKKKETVFAIIGAPVWMNGPAVGYAGSQRFESIRNAVKDEIDVFCNDYLKANPKP
jgi:hypothetical protein